MLLSIIVPIYKVENYISTCLTSILSQLTSDCELVLVNDGSPDNSFNIAKKICAGVENVIFFSQENKGLSVTRNMGVTLATGKYIWFVDSDDWLCPLAVDRALEIVSNFNYDIIATVLLNYHERKDSYSVEYKPISGEITGKQYLMRKYPQGASQRFIINRKFWDTSNLSFFPRILHEDSLLGFQMLYLANLVYVESKPLYVYRIRQSGSIMSTTTVCSAYNLLDIHKKLNSFCEERVLVEDRRWFKRRIYHIIECAFGFSRGIIDTSEFKQFYTHEKKYIKKESLCLFFSPFTFLKGLIYFIAPYRYWKFRILFSYLKKLLCF